MYYTAHTYIHTYTHIHTCIHVHIYTQLLITLWSSCPSLFLYFLSPLSRVSFFSPTPFPSTSPVFQIYSKQRIFFYLPCRLSLYSIVFFAVLRLKIACTLVCVRSDEFFREKSLPRPVT